MVLHRSIPPLQAAPSLFDFSGGQEPFDFVPDGCSLLFAVAF
jgi:hypothetical protein